MFRLDQNETDHIEDFRALGYHPENHQSNHIWRGTKADIYEAGHRVPTFVRWPGVVNAGGVCDETVTLTDWFATFSEMLDRPLSNNEAEDSFSLLPLLTGPQSWNRAPVINHSITGMFAIRDGRWKLIAGNGSGGRQSPRGKPFEGPYQLYDLQSDPSETKNLIEANPEIATRLEKALEKIRSQDRSR